MGGRNSMFGDLRNGRRLQGVISKTGSRRFDDARKRLARLAKWVLKWSGPVSDAAVIDYLARGHEQTVAHFHRQRRKAK